ncbi:RidA family protein [Hyphomonas johnsonii]|uniref:Endoribonuclease L-PSP n=1 Tax=Hyphomonas johnsonii MHS-2 TaxID=1280950 RepID=A0A059FR30_9PROT|nr:Rid family hydrolase [Hyphomonas johnsonii]KCZ92981.1 endoribonuclease L-PSP [Hyphomonas johnsonii MHS-2]
MIRYALMGTALATLTGCIAVDVDDAHFDTNVSHFGGQAVNGMELPFSKAVRAGNTIYLAGELGIDPATGALVPGGTGPQTTQIFANLERTLNTFDADLSNLVKCTVYLGDMADYADMNAAYAAAVPDPKPARATVGVSGLAVGANLEIDCIAVAS